MNVGDNRGDTRPEWTHSHSSCSCTSDDCAPCAWLEANAPRPRPPCEFRLDTEYRRALVRATPWGYRGTCTCGWKQPPGFGTEKDARRAWYNHRDEGGRR